MTKAPAHGDIFAGNRALGGIALAVANGAGSSRRVRVHEAGSLRVRFPHAAKSGALEAMIINTAGGVAGGDRFNIDVAVGAAARLTVTTAAAEKIYRSLGPDARIDVTLEVATGATLAWLPQETILFDRAGLRRTIHVDLARGATLVLAEAIVFGRSAMGETVRSGRVFDRWRVRVDGRLVFAETMRLDGTVAESLAKGAVAAGGIAVASVLKVPGDDAGVAAARAIEQSYAGEVGVSAWNGLALARLVARDGEALRRDLVGVVTAMGGAPLPRLWLN